MRPRKIFAWLVIACVAALIVWWWWWAATIEGDWDAMSTPLRIAVGPARASMVLAFSAGLGYLVTVFVFPLATTLLHWASEPNDNSDDPEVF